MAHIKDGDAGERSLDAATMAASAGIKKAGELLPAITRPISEGLRPALSRAIRAAAAPVCAFR